MCDCNQELKEEVGSIKAWTTKHEKENSDSFKMVLDAIAENTQLVNNLTDDTRWFVDTKKDLDGTYRIGLKVQKGIKVVSGIAIFGLVIDWLIKHSPF